MYEEEIIDCLLDLTKTVSEIINTIEIDLDTNVAIRHEIKSLIQIEKVLERLYNQYKIRVEYKDKNTGEKIVIFEDTIDWVMQYTIPRLKRNRHTYISVYLPFEDKPYYQSCTRTK